MPVYAWAKTARNGPRPARLANVLGERSVRRVFLVTATAAPRSAAVSRSPRPGCRGARVVAESRRPLVDRVPPIRQGDDHPRPVSSSASGSPRILYSLRTGSRSAVPGPPCRSTTDPDGVVSTRTSQPRCWARRGCTTKSAAGGTAPATTYGARPSGHRRTRHRASWVQQGRGGGRLVTAGPGGRASESSRRRVTLQRHRLDHRCNIPADTVSVREKIQAQPGTGSPRSRAPTPAAVQHQPGRILLLVLMGRRARTSSGLDHDPHVDEGILAQRPAAG